MKTVYIVRGPCTKARKVMAQLIVDGLIGQNLDTCAVSSHRQFLTADQLIALDGGNHLTLGADLRTSHDKAYEYFLGLLEADEFTHVVVDNPFPSVATVRPYVAMAKQLGLNWHIVDCPIPVDRDNPSVAVLNWRAFTPTQYLSL